MCPVNQGMWFPLTISTSCDMFWMPGSLPFQRKTLLTVCNGSILLKTVDPPRLAMHRAVKAHFLHAATSNLSLGPSAQNTDLNLRRALFCNGNRSRLFQQNRSRAVIRVFTHGQRAFCIQRFFSHWSLLIAKRKPRCDIEFIGSAPCRALVLKLVQ